MMPTVISMAGAVGLTCLGLVIFNWKLQQGKANEHTSENLCCRTFDEALCAQEATHYRAKGFCNCRLTQENEIKVTSTVGSRKEMPLLQENSQQAALAHKSTALDRSLRNLQGKDPGTDSTFFGLDGRWLHSGCSEPPERTAAFNETGILTRYCAKSVEKLRNLEAREGQPQTLPQHVTRTLDISSDTFSRRYATGASALARESLEKHLTNESWQPPVEKEDNGLQPHRQRHFLTSSSSKPCEPEEHYVQKILQKHRSKYDDPCGLLNQSRPRYLLPSNSLICKYVPCDQFQDYVKEKKLNRRELSKLEKEQIQINSAIEKFLRSEDHMELSALSTKTKQTCSPKNVSFHDPDLVEKNKLGMLPKTATHWKQKKSKNNKLTNVDLKICSKSQERNARKKRFTDTQILKKKRTNQSDLKGKIKGQNLRIKLNLHPFRKVRIHPEKSLPEPPKKPKRVLLSPKKLPKAFEKEVNINLASSADFSQQSESNNYVRLTSKRLPLKHGPKQTSYYKRNTKNVPLLRANDFSVVSQSSVEDNCHPTHVPGRSPSPLPLPIPITAQRGPSYSLFSGEQMQGAIHLASEVPSYLLATWGNTGSDVLPLGPYGEPTNQGAIDPTEHITRQGKSKISELGKTSQISLSLRNQTQLSGGQETDTYNKERTSDQNQALEHEEQKSSLKQRGNGEKALIMKTPKSHQIVEGCIRDKERNDTGKDLLNTETYDSFPILQTEFKSKLIFMKTNLIPSPNRIEPPKDISTSFSTQAIWHLTNDNEKGIDSVNALPRDDGTEALEIKIEGKEEKKMLSESKTNSSVLIQTTQMTLKGTAKEKQQTWENGKSEKYILHDSSSVRETVTAKDLSITNSHETENRLSHSENDLQINNNVRSLREVQNSQPNKDNSAHKEGEMAEEKQEVLSLLPELKDNSFDAENEVLLIPSRINEAENSVQKPALYPPFAEYANTSSLEAEQSEQNNSNNNHFLL